MEEMMRGLGQRIVLAARAAVALHLSELSNEIGRQQESAGGAGWNFSKEGDLPSLGDREVRADAWPNVEGEACLGPTCGGEGEACLAPTCLDLRSPLAERRAG